MIKNIIFLAFFMLTSSLLADKSVSVTATIDRADYADKSIENLQMMVMQQAKLEAATQLFGDFIKSETIITDGSLIKDLILAKQGGVVHIQGNPEYANGKGLGELQVTIKAMATQKDIDDMKIHRIELVDFVYTNRNMTLNQLKIAAKEAFVIEAISKKRPSIKTESNAAEQAKKLAVSVNIEKMDFNADWLAYKLSGYVEYIPIFLRNDDASEPAIEIIKDKAIVIVSSSSGKVKQFQSDYKENGFVFAKKALKFIETEAQKNEVALNVQVKLLIPQEITSDEVSIHANGASKGNFGPGGWYSWYEASVNGIKIKKDESEAVTVINDGALKYVTLNIAMGCKKGAYKNHFHKVIKNLESLSYSIESKKLHATIFNEKNIPARNNKVKLIVNSTTGKNKKFDLAYEGNGLIFNKKVVTYIAQTSQKNMLYMNVQAKLLIPKQIKTDTVAIQANSASKGNFGPGGWYAWYSAYVNGTQIQEGESTVVNVTHEGNLKYVTLNVVMECKQGQFKNYFLKVIRSLGTLNYAVTDTEEGEKFFALKALNIEYLENTTIAINSMKDKTVIKNKDLRIASNENGFIFNKKVLTYIAQVSKKYKASMEINLQLEIPQQITTDTVTIQANAPSKGNFGPGGWYAWYEASINGTKIKDGENALITLGDNKRYVELKIKIECKKGQFKDYFLKVIDNLGKLHYTVTDSEDAEKYFALHVNSEQ